MWYNNCSLTLKLKLKLIRILNLALHLLFTHTETETHIIMTSAFILDKFITILNTLESEIKAYTSEEDLWKLSGEIKNTPANLALHLCGNLRHFIGAVIGNDGYVRDRDAEFSRTDVTRDEIISEISQTKTAIQNALKDDINFDSSYPVRLLDKDWTTGGFLFYIYGHFNYHLGQINYHRRMKK